MISSEANVARHDLASHARVVVPLALVMPVKNEAATLSDFFGAYSRFSVLPAEIVFVDAGSCDGTAKVLESWCHESVFDGVTARYIRHPGALPGAGRNVGVRETAAPYVVFLDAGIRPEPHWLEQLYAIVNQGACDYALGVCRFDSHDTVGLAVCALTNGVGRTQPVLPASIFRRSVFDKAGYFDPRLRAGEDLLWLAAVRAACGAPRVCEAARVHYQRYPATLPAVFSKWLTYEASVSGTGIGRRKRAVLILGAMVFCASSIAGASYLLAMVAMYVVLRGILDPIRRSRSLVWWRRAPAAGLLAPFVAAAIDCGSLCGSIHGFWNRIMRG